VGGGSGGGNAETKVNTTKEQRDVLAAAFPIWQKYLDHTPAMPSGPSVAGFGAGEAGSRQQIFSGVKNIQNLNNMATRNYGQMSTATDVTHNPYLMRAMQGAVSPVFEQLGSSQRDAFNRLSQDIIPGLRTGAVQQGVYGSPKYGTAVGRAVTGTGNQISDQTNQAVRAALDATSRMGSDAYAQGLDAQGKALAMLPQFNQQMMLPGQIGQTLADRDRSMQQMKINAARQDYWQKNLLPLQLSQQIVGSSMGVPTGTITMGGGGGGGGWQGALQGGAGGAATGFAMGGPWGAAAGGGLGMLLGYM
jgi:hypothetical protein